MSGGGNVGAWEAGVVWGLTHYGNPEDFAWNVISGVSAGAINTSFTSVWNVGEEVKMSEFMSDIWANLKSEDFYVKWPGGIAAGIFAH